MKRFLITGGAGFIGSHIAEELVRKRHYVRILDNFSSGKIENLSGFIDKVELIRGDICSMKDCLKATKGIDFVLHQAALRSVPKSMKDPHSYNKVNIGGVLNMLEASLENKIKSFVFASSSSVYGDINIFPEKENFLPQPVSPYALSKLCGEHYCKIFSIHHGLPTASLRYFNVFGPRQSLDDEYAVVIPKFIHCILHGQKPPVFGTGKQSRDFSFVKDVVQANFLASQRPDFKGEVFNVAGGRSYTVLELVKILNVIIAKDIKPVFLPKRAGDVFKTEADLSRTKRLLGFKPGINFMKGLELTVRYFEEKWLDG